MLMLYLFITLTGCVLVKKAGNFMFKKIFSVSFGLAMILTSSVQAAYGSSSFSVASKASGGGQVKIVPVSTSYSLAVWTEWKSPTSYSLMSAKVSSAGKFSPAVKIASLTTTFQSAPHYEVAVSPKKSIQVAWVNSKKSVEYNENYYTSDLMFTSSTDGAKWATPAKAVNSRKINQEFCGQQTCGYVVTAFGYDRSNRLHLLYAMSVLRTKISIMSTSTADLKTWTKPTSANTGQGQGATAQIAPTATGLIAAGIGASNQGFGIWASVKATSKSATWSAPTQIAASCSIVCSIVGLHLIPSRSGDVTAAWLETTATQSYVQLNKVVWSHTTKKWGPKTTVYTGTSLITGAPYQTIAWGQHVTFAQNGDSYAFSWLENDANTNAEDFKVAVFNNGAFSNVLNTHHRDVFGAGQLFFEQYGLAVSPTGAVVEVLADIISGTAFISEVSANSVAVETPLLVDLPTFGDSAVTYNANGKLLLLQVSSNQVTNSLSRMIAILNH
jgi:hypothetical protein